MSLTDKTIFITGANGGVGMEIVKYALANNAKTIYCAARDISTLNELKTNESSIVPIQMDITDLKGVQSVASKIDAIDMLINTAGINSGARIFASTTVDFDVNVIGTLNVYRAFEAKIKEGGAIITITSILALVNLPVMALYCASKSALHSLTQALRAELASKNIEVYEVLAGPIETRMTQGQEMPKTKPQEIVKEIFAALQTKTYDIYPDTFSRMIYENLQKDPRGVELDFAASVGKTV